MKHKKNIDKVKPYKPGKPVEELKREKGLRLVYKMASNELPFSPAYVKKAVLKELKNINRYPESSCFYLRSKLARKLGVKADSLVFGNGSDELITLVLKAFIEKGDEVITAFPSFLVYQIQAQIFGAKVTKVPLKDYSYNLDEIAKKVTPKTKIIFIANPDNPTGTYLSQEKVNRFLKKIPAEVLLFFDEAYFEFAPSDFPRSLKMLKQRKNMIVTRTFSKAYGLAGLRIGYGVTDPEIAGLLNKIREPFNVNRLAQVAAEAALDNKGFVREMVKFTNREKNLIYQALDALGLFYIRSYTNFILVDLGSDTSSLYNYMLSNGVIIRELKGWGLNNLFRITIGTSTQNKKFIKLLIDYVSNEA